MTWHTMNNLSMKRKLQKGEARDVSACPVTEEGDFIFPPGFFEEGRDYCDGEREAWIWSIGRNAETGEVRASTTSKFYEREGWTCLWLR